MFKSYRRMKRNINRVTKPARKINRYSKKLNRLTKSLPKGVSYHVAPNTPVDEMDGYQFESYLAKLYEDLGYRVYRTGRSRDFGADLIICKDNKKTIIQSKRYKASVRISAVQEISAAKKYYNADATAVVTNSYFTKSAEQLAEINHVKLITGDKLNRMIAKRDKMKEEVSEEVEKKKETILSKIIRSLN